MNNIFSKFNLYDQIGYLMVGGIALLVILFDITLFSQLNIDYFQIESFWVVIVVIYFLGHVIQSLANLTNKLPIINVLIKEHKNEFNDYERGVLNTVKKYLKLDGVDQNKKWNLCYMLACAKDVTGQVQSFNAYYSLYRGWLVIFLLQSLFSLVMLIFKFSDTRILTIFLLSSLLTYLFYKRSERFWNYTRNKVFETFTLIERLKL